MIRYLSANGLYYCYLKKKIKAIPNKTKTEKEKNNDLTVLYGVPYTYDAEIFVVSICTFVNSL